MSDFASSPPPVQRKTIRDAEARHTYETTEGVGIRIYMGDPDPELEETPLSDPNYLGTVFMQKNVKALQAKFASLKLRKPRAHQWTEAELLPLNEEAENGTIWVGIADWNDPDTGAPMPNTPANLARVMKIGFVREVMNERYKQDSTWEEYAKEQLQKNS